MTLETVNNNNNHDPAQPLPILISGAGICSLLLAQSLRRAGIPFVVFERDASVSFRAQGYRLRLSNEGLDAIESVLRQGNKDGDDHWDRFWATCSKTTGPQGTTGLGQLNAVTGEALQPGGDGGGGGGAGVAEGTGQKPMPKGIDETLTSRNGQVVGISRGDMRRLFMEGCEDHIRWSHQVVAYEHNDGAAAGGGGGVRAVFADGSKSVLGSMLIAGEGIYSKIAKQVSGGKLKVYDTGARGIHGQAPTPAFKGLGQGVWRLVDTANPNGRVFLMTSVRPGEMDDPEAKFGWTMGAVPGVINPPGDDLAVIGQPAADVARALAAEWHPRLRPVVEHMVDSEAAFWKITCSTPSGVPEWPNDPCVTVIGDAVHSMTPAGGIGANTAVRDSALLGRLIAQAGGYRDGLTKEYEDEMRVYASEAVGISYGHATTSFGISLDENSPVV